jgi:hypothetical protein
MRRRCQAGRKVPAEDLGLVSLSDVVDFEIAAHMQNHKPSAIPGPIIIITCI